MNPENSLARVLRTLQLDAVPSPSSDSEKSFSEKEEEEEEEEITPYPNLFVIGDAADAFGAIAAGHNAYYQVRFIANLT